MRLYRVDDRVWVGGMAVAIVELCDYYPHDIRYHVSLPVTYKGNRTSCIPEHAISPMLEEEVHSLLLGRAPEWET